MSKSYVSRQQVEDKMREMIVGCWGADPDDVTDNASSTNDLGADSLDTVEMIMEFEKEFGINIPDDDAADLISTFGKSVNYVCDKLGLTA